MNSTLRHFFRLPFRGDAPHRIQPPLSEAQRFGNGDVAFEGNIAAIALENIFQLFDFAALSGKLEVRSSINSGSFYFTNGLLTYGMLQNNQRKIGEILLVSRVITEEQLQECLLLHEQGRSQRRLGQILLEKGYTPSERLDDSLLRQIKEAFFETLSWKEGTFAFYQNQAPAPAITDIQLQERVDHLLLEGMIYLDHCAASEL